MTTYTVQSGDTLFRIAEKFYGDGNQWTRILDANPGIDPNNLQIGQQLQIPSTTVNNNLPNSDKIPTEWKQVATPYVSMLMKAFMNQGINNPNVFAYACATISHESSWNPNAVNTTDTAANTGYPGAGLAQITWKDNYKAVGDATGIDFVGHPEYMFDPNKSLSAQAAFFKLNGMIPYIERGDYESAAGKYNTGDFNGRNKYTRKVANDTSLWLSVFS
jgi:LysM repeat protein